jgi:hypothetical protein
MTWIGHVNDEWTDGKHMPKDKQQADTHVYMLDEHIYLFLQYISVNHS